MICSAAYDSPVGRLVLKAEKGYLTELTLSDAAVNGMNDDAIDCAVKWLDCYFAGNIPDVCPKIRLNGTHFRMLIWEMLRDIPYGQTVSYGELAAKAADALGKSRMSAQAVGNAVGHNPVCIIIPCHRVIGSDGSLIGYAYGIEMKKKLLKLENIDMEAF